MSPLHTIHLWVAIRSMPVEAGRACMLRSPGGSREREFLTTMQVVTFLTLVFP